ncbi:MAG: hypothetical protein OK422_06325 [Thaumarchaeota archaeon]|nr:hypothetical protein [Nitrososphaerota archaeon]
MLRHARYGPRGRYLDPPPAGMCISVFAIVKRGTKFLVGTPEPHHNWREKWLFSWMAYSSEELEEAYREKRLPSTYLLEGEDPADALKRIMRDQLHMPSYKASGPRVRSYTSPSDWFPGNKHWDLVLVYEVATNGKVKPLPWWKELAFEERSKLRSEDFGWNSDFVVDFGVAEPRT